jgi:outer membrane protein
MRNRNSIALAASIFLSLFALQTSAYETGDIFVRAGLTSVQPDESSKVLTSDDTPLAGSFANVDSNTQLGLTATYMLTPSWGVELLAATPFKHTVSATVPGLLTDANVAEVKHLPPTLSAVFYFTTSGAFKPYIGAGLNFTTFFNEDAVSSFEAAAGSTDVSLSDSWGLASQIGFDYELTEKWSLNASARFIKIRTEADIQTTDLGLIETTVDIDPTVYTLSIGYTY